jgi:hypothetical protein
MACMGPPDGCALVVTTVSDHDTCNCGRATMVRTEANEDRTHKGRKHPGAQLGLQHGNAPGAAKSLGQAQGAEAFKKWTQMGLGRCTLKTC